MPALANYNAGFLRCAVHQQTQRTYAVVGDTSLARNAVVPLDANLQVVATVEAVEDAKDEAIRDVAVHGDQVIVLTTDSHAKGSGLRLLDLDGRYLRTIAAAQFHYPWVVTASHGRAFVVDADDYSADSGKTLHVVDIQSGHILQSVRVDLEGGVSAILVDGDEVYISSYGADEVVVLQLAGSEA